MNSAAYIKHTIILENNLVYYLKIKYEYKDSAVDRKFALYQPSWILI